MKPSTLEQIRDIYDTSKIAIVLIGMPGIEKKFSRYPQLYSRVGFVHNFKPISNKEMKQVIETKMKEFNINYTNNGKQLQEAFAEIIRITRGNLRTIQRLMAQINRVMEINSIDNLEKDVIDTAKSNLIIGN